MEQPKHILVVANRSVATPTLLQEIERRAMADICEFSLLIPDASSGEIADWTLDHAVRLLSKAAGMPVRGLMCRRRDPYEAIAEVLAAEHYDEVMISTLPEGRSRWLRRSLPRRVARLGVPVAVITSAGEAVLQA